MPRVSIIVPNFNHAPYLRLRVESVLSQTYSDFDVILMDDASTDDSRSILQRYASDPRVRLMFNETNSGSTFKQWNKGVGAARGEFIWLAESDDYADTHFLERLVPLLENNPKVGVAYCQSHVIDADGQMLRTTHRDFVFAGSEDRWESDFIMDGRAACAHYLSQQNIIYNASAAVFRRSLFTQIGGADESMRINGDWKFWAAMLLRSDLAHIADPLNYFRTHRQNVRSRTKFAISIFETVDVLNFLGRKMTIDPFQMQQHESWMADGFINNWIWGNQQEKKDLWRAFNALCELHPEFRMYAARRVMGRLGSAIRNGKGRRWITHLAGGKATPRAKAPIANDRVHSPERL